MRRTVGIGFVLVLAAFAGAVLISQQAPQQQGQQPPTATAPLAQQGGPPITQRVSEVDLVLAVVNRRQKFVTDLERGDFKVMEDNQQQEIKFFNQQTDLPLRVGLLLDTSNSIRSRLQFEKDAADDFLFDVLRPEKDLAFLMTFDSDPAVVQDFTNDLDALRNAVDKQHAGGGTALYDAMIKASEKLGQAPMAKGPKTDVRRVLVVISDGDDNLSNSMKSDAIDAAQRAGVVIYTISTSTDWIVPEESKDIRKQMDRKFAYTDGDKVLQAFTEGTGGRAFYPYHVEDVAQSFMSIVTELRSQYLLGYSPSNAIADGRFRKIRIEIPGHKELDVRTRKGYFAIPVSSGGHTPTSPSDH
ncbi:MAG TPA: VWA domain-containing protein [Candidatus Limnocylindrales bacterium]|nr:VWA domain-containing protein [Candidatus Limnocylindrales bacterium]